MKKPIAVLFLLISLISLNSFSQSKEEIITNSSAEEFNDLISARTDASVILDVRTSKEFESGHIENAVNIDYFSNDFENSLSKLDKSKTYFVYCKSGVRSGKASNMLNKLGFKKIYTLKGGIDNWSAKGFSVVK